MNRCKEIKLLELVFPPASWVLCLLAVVIPFNMLWFSIIGASFPSNWPDRIWVEQAGDEHLIEA